MKLWHWQLILPIALTATASAQDHPNHTKIAIINGLIGGSTAAVTAAIQHRSIKSALIKGSVGGLTVYAGKCPAHVDWSLSAKHDALILFGSSGEQRIEAAGVIKIRDAGSFRLVHEEIHVAQDQFVTTALEDPLEGWLAPMIPGGKDAHRYFEFGILAPVWAAVNSQIVRENRPWEKEADAFMEKC